MICNVCGNDTRCFSLTENVGARPMFRGIGMLFNICPDCLGKLIEGIKTEKTEIEDPQYFPIPKRMQEMEARILSSRAQSPKSPEVLAAEAEAKAKKEKEDNP